MERIPKIDEVFGLFESIVDDAIDSSAPDDILIRSYFSIVELLINLTCTGKYATKFSEFFYVRYVKKYLEKHLEKLCFTEEKIKGRSSPRFAALYKGKKVILSSDISIPSAGISEMPDIFVGLEKENGIILPLAIFEIKLHQDKKDLAPLIKRFLKMKDDFENKFSGYEVPYFVWLYLRYEKYLKQDYEEEIAQFKSLSENNLIVVNEITEWTNSSYKSNFKKSNVKGGINSVLNKIVRKIEAF